MKTGHARAVVGMLMGRAGNGPLSLSELRKRKGPRGSFQNDDLPGEVFASFGREYQWAYLVNEVVNSYWPKSWTDEYCNAVDVLARFVQNSIDDAEDVRDGTGSSFESVGSEYIHDPLGQRYESSEDEGLVTYQVTNRPNHTTLVGPRGGLVSEPNYQPTGDREAREQEIREFLELAAGKRGLTFDQFTELPKQGKASGLVGARLDALSRSCHELIGLGYKAPEIGEVIGRDRRRMSDLLKRRL